MNPSGDAADGRGTCDVAIDNKTIDDNAMDVTGDESVGVDQNELTNGKKDESDIGIGIKDSGDFTADSGLAPFTALNDDENEDNLNDEAEMNIDNEDETNDANDGSEADAGTAMDDDDGDETAGQLEDNTTADSADTGVSEEADYQTTVSSHEEQEEVQDANDDDIDGNVDGGEANDDSVIDQAEGMVSEEADDIVDSVIDKDETADHGKNRSLCTYIMMKILEK